MASNSHPIIGLFFQSNGSSSPCRFAMSQSASASSVRIGRMIREGGGILEDPRMPDKAGYRFHLVEPKAILLPHKDDGDFFSVNYIDDCYSAGKLLPNLIDYRVNNRSIYENYEPLRVLLGFMKWTDVPRTLSTHVRSPTKGVEEETSDIDEEVLVAPIAPIAPRRVNSSNSTETDKSKKSGCSSELIRVRPSAAILNVVNAAAQEKTREKVSAWMTKSKPNLSAMSSSTSVLNMTKTGRAPYTTKEQESIIQDIIRNNAYNRLRGVQYWKECELEKRVSKGARTWQSMKEHFRKKLAPILHTFNLSANEMEKFSKSLNGIPVEISTDEEDDDQNVSTDYEPLGENHQAQSTPKSNSPKDKKKMSKRVAKKTTKADDEHKDEDELFAEVQVEFERTRIRTSPRIAATATPSPAKPSTPVMNNKNNDEEVTFNRKRRKLWTDKQYDRLSLVKDTPSRQAKESEKAKVDYLQIQNPIPSTSRARPPAPVFKVPAPRPTLPKSISSAEEEEIDADSESSDDNLSTISTSSRRAYGHSEELKIAQWVASTRRFTEIGGNVMWKLMADSNVVPGRSYQSLKERFRKHILPKIDMYDISEDDKEAFKRLHRRRSKTLPKKK